MKAWLSLAVVFALGALLACSGPKGDKGDPGDPGTQGPGGPAGAAGAPAPGGNNMVLWGSDPSKWARTGGATATVVANTSDVVEGDASFEFTVPSGTQGAIFVYGDYIPVDPRAIYRGSISVKLVNGAGDFSAGVEAYDKGKTLLTANDTQPALYFMALNQVLTTGAWTDFTGLIVGEGVGLDQFPAGTRYIRPIVVVNRNNIGTTLVDALKVAPDTQVRTLARWQGYAADGTDTGALSGRSVTIRKLGRSTGLRVTWSDNFRVATASGACRWEVLFNGAACANPGAVVLDKYEGGTSSNRHDPATFVGTCMNLAPGNVTVSTRVYTEPGFGASDCYTGWNGQLASLDVEEVK